VFGKTRAICVKIVCTDELIRWLTTHALDRSIGVSDVAH
jgi:hypothetical protein